MRIRRRAVIAAALALTTAGAATIAVGWRGTDRAPVTAPVAAEWSVAEAAAPADPAAPTPGAASALGSRAGTPSASASATARPVTAAARPATEVAKAAPVSVGYLAGRYRVTPQEAGRRLALQDLSAPLAEKLAARFPDSYAGMWLDQDGGGVLRIAATDPAPVATALAGVPDAAHVKVVRVAHSLRALSTAAGTVAAALGVTAGVDVLADGPTNEIVVLTGDALRADDSRLAAALASVGVPTRAQPRERAGTILKACDPRYCATAPMRGGIRLDVPRDDGTVGGCTTGFNLRDRSGRYYVLTAGHCVVGIRHQKVDLTWHQYLGPKVPVGIESTSPVLAENDALPNDYAVLPYQDGALSRWSYRGGSGPSLVNYWCVSDNAACATKGSHDVPVTGYTAYSAVQVGWVVCATGSAYTPKAGERYVDSGAGAGYVPGTRCGTVTGKTGGGIDVRICARPGDSGSPLFTESNGRALGILHDGDPGLGPCTKPDEKNYYAPVSSILDVVNGRTGLGLQVATRSPAIVAVGASHR